MGLSHATHSRWAARNALLASAWGIGCPSQHCALERAVQCTAEAVVAVPVLCRMRHVPSLYSHVHRARSRDREGPCGVLLPFSLSPKDAPPPPPIRWRLVAAAGVRGLTLVPDFNRFGL